MPPWLPEHGYGDFADEQRLSDEEIRLLGAWAAAGAPEGNHLEAPPAPQFPNGWKLGTPDLVVEVAQPFSLSATGRDVYWNFLFRPSVKSRRWVKAIEIRPGKRNLIHHANLLVDRTPPIRSREVIAMGGFPGMDLNIERSPFDPDGEFLFWKPGSTVRVEPKGFAWRLDPGTELVLNTHMRPGGAAEQVRPSIAFYFTDEPQTRFPIVFELQADNDLNIPANARDFKVGDDFKLPVDSDILGVYPHEHYLGRIVEAWATLPDGARKWLIRIPAWNPDWQTVYYYREPVFLPAGSVISVRWHYDNSAANPRNPNSPPKRVTAGNEARDEMAHFWVQALPRGEDDRRREIDEAVQKHRLEKNPGDFTANLNLGAVMLSKLNAQGAVAALETAVTAEPARNDARNMLGLALAATGRLEDAVAQYDIVLQSDSDEARARFNRANAFMRLGRVDDAIRDYRMVTDRYPDDPLARERLEEALRVKERVAP
jgi:hypothetical protein